MWDGEQVWVYQQPHAVSVKGGEHLADGWDPDLPLVEHGLFFSEKNTACYGSVGVSVWIVIQADHVALGDKMEEDGGDEGEEANDSTESNLQSKALDSYSSLHEDVGHEQEAGPAGTVREQLHPSNSSAQAANVNEVLILGLGRLGQTTGGQTLRPHLVV